MKRILSVIAVLVQFTLLAQNNLTMKVGLEKDYREFQELNIYTNNATFDFAASKSAAGLVQINCLKEE
jgi:hypothetical protein